MAVVVASLAIGFILGAIAGAAGYGLLIAPTGSEETPERSAQPEPPTAEPNPQGGIPAKTVNPSRPPSRLLKRDEIVTWSEKVNKELKILEVAQPGALRVLERNPRSIHVVRVSTDCTADKFDSAEARLLKDWVASGGIVWARNDVPSLFDVSFERRSAFGWQGECTPSSNPDLSPILAGIQRAQVRWEHSEMANLSCERVVPLLSAETTAFGGTQGRKCIWSLVPYGKGWLSDVKKIDETKYDGARFWLNFRMFCLGWDIPGAKVSTSDFVRQSGG
ncbi:MAG: hypothetical protein AMK72_02825 [Planctomycetes bacterium SM23_25]|nr:MAG: hypothetical protein AMK72_02825 [Planctomycetes bacterium SM23_25]